jgi:hypothetical protein
MNQAVQAFATEARIYCAWAISIEEGDQGAAAALRRIVALYQAALRLPAPNAEGTQDGPEFVRTEARKQVLAACGRLPLQYYAEQFSPLLCLRPRKRQLAISRTTLPIFSRTWSRACGISIMIKRLMPCGSGPSDFRLIGDAMRAALFGHFMPTWQRIVARDWWTASNRRCTRRPPGVIVSGRW